MMRGRLKKQPYVAIVGVATREETFRLCDAIPVGTGRDLQIGIKVTPKSLTGNGNLWPYRYPEPALISQIFSGHPRVLNMIHWHAGESDTLFEDLVKLMELGGRHFDGFQLNVTRPHVDQVRLFAECYPEAYIVLQVDSDFIGEASFSPMKVAARVQQYGLAVQGVVFDQMDAINKPFNPHAALPFLRAMRDVSPNINLGVAGRLSLEDLPRLDSLFHEFQDLSLLTEEGVRNPIDDTFNLQLASEFIGQSYAAFSRAAFS